MRRFVLIMAVVVTTIALFFLYISPNTNTHLRFSVPGMQDTGCQKSGPTYLQIGVECGCNANVSLSQGFPLRTNAYDYCGHDQTQTPSLVALDFLINAMIVATVYFIVRRFVIKKPAKTKN
jgi:hypothetical protein